MEEITPGIRHWSAAHPDIGWTVSSYWLPGLHVLLDPLAVPDEVQGIDEIVLTNRHHKRDALAARERFGAPVRVPRLGLHEFAENDPVEPYDFGAPLASGEITPYQVTELWPDDGALHIPSLDALAIADTVLCDDGRLQWMPDVCFGDISAEKQSIRSGLAALAEQLDFSHLLLAHGDPIAGAGRDRLLRFLQEA